MTEPWTPEIFHEVTKRSVVNKCNENTTDNKNNNNVPGCQFGPDIPADGF